MKARIVISLIFIMTALSLPAQQDAAFDYGNIKDGVYTNSYFQVTVPFPKTWHIQDREQMKKLTEQGADLIAGDDKKLKENIIKASDVNTAYLLTLFKHQVGSPVDFNPGFMLLAENISAYPGIKTGEDYLFHAKNLLKRANVAYVISDKFTKKEISGREFYEMDSALVYNKMKIIQKYYTSVMNGFALSIIMTYVTDEGEKDLHKILSGVKFEEKKTEK